MKYFSFREVAFDHPSNRGTYLKSQEAMNLPFLKENRFHQIWVGMYMFKTPTPKEGDAAFGNFYIEIDDEDFMSLRNKMLTVTDYLWERYDIRPEYMNFFVTNRSIWLGIPTKVFGCFGKSYLHKIHKIMAEEIHMHLLKSGFSKGLDLSIYRWNGLMRGLGSYLPASKRWVTKFSLSDLEDAVSFDDLTKAKFDNGYTFEDVEIVPKAVAWFKRAEIKMWSENKETTNIILPSTHEGMEEFIRKGELPFNRNLHIYSVALYLKDKGFSLEETIQKIQTSFQNSYVYTKEAIRTIQSAYKGNKHFSPKAAQAYLDESIFKCYTQTEKNSFIVPRSFIQTLHNMKAHYQVYKLLFEILYTYQAKREVFRFNLKGHKYKKEVLGYFEKLQSAGFISYTQKEYMIEASLVHQPKEIYQSYIVVPNAFINSPSFRNMKREFILFVELWKSGIKTSKNKYTYFVQISMETIQKRLGMTKTTLYRYLSILKRQFLFFLNFICPTGDKKQYREAMKKKIPMKKSNTLSKISSLFTSTNENYISESLSFSIFHSFSNASRLIIKCNYSP